MNYPKTIFQKLWCLPFFICLLLSPFTTVWSRSIPDTTDGVHVWADQLQTYNTGQDAFVAAHIVASQKLTKNRIDAIRQYNPDFIVLQYHKAYGVDIGYNIVAPNTWGPDIDTMNDFAATHSEEYGDVENYYIHWTNENDPNHRVQHYWEGNLEFHLADIRHLGFRTYLINETTRRCEDIGFDGTFFDVAYFPWYEYEPDYNTSVGLGGDGTMWYEYAPWHWPSIHQNASLLAQNWNALVVPYWRAITAGYRTGETIYYGIINCGRMVTGWYEPVYLDDVDGAMSEGWMTGGDSNNRLVGSDWELSASRILRYITGNDKILIGQPNNPSSDNIAMREWWIANYLLLKNDKSFYFYAYGMEIYWWPEYEIDLGAFSEPPTRTLDDLLVNGTASLYSRQYQSGLVLVNPGETTQYYTLESTHYQYEFSGGGYVSRNEKPAMRLEHSTPLSGTVAVDPHTALILWKPSDTGNVYVAPGRNCGDKTPCYATVQEAVDTVTTGETVLLAQGTYPGPVTLHESKSITLRGGWNSTFSFQTPDTTFIAAPDVLQGSVTMQMLTIRP